jgi:hypothetical protein
MKKIEESSTQHKLNSQNEDGEIFAKNKNSSKKNKSRVR